MNFINNISLLNTGGTLTKIYNPLNGELFVPQNNTTIENIFKKMNIKIDIQGCVFKDSLNINDEDREQILQNIKLLKNDKVIVIHGTDTMNESAKYIAKNIKNKSIIFTGAMKPFEIDNIESIVNISMCIGFLNSCSDDNIYICMSSLIKKHNEIYKNKEKGIFNIY